jgi:hypothetical protein
MRSKVNHLNHRRRIITAMESRKNMPDNFAENEAGRIAKHSNQRGKRLARVALQRGGPAHRRYAIVFIELSFPYLDVRETNPNFLRI